MKCSIGNAMQVKKPVYKKRILIPPFHITHQLKPQTQTLKIDFKFKKYCVTISNFKNEIWRKNLRSLRKMCTSKAILIYSQYLNRLQRRNIKHGITIDKETRVLSFAINYPVYFIFFYFTKKSRPIKDKNVNMTQCINELSKLKTNDVNRLS